MPYSGPVYIDDVLPILERMQRSRVFYAGIIPKIDQLISDIRSLRQPAIGTGSKTLSDGSSSLAITQLLFLLEEVRKRLTRYRLQIFEPGLGRELVQVWPLFVNLYNMVLEARAYGAGPELQGKITEAVRSLQEYVSKTGL